MLAFRRLWTTRETMMGDDAASRFNLTAAEGAVLAHLVDGRTPAEIALLQDVSLATVRTHIARLHEKFGVTRTLDVVRLVMAAGPR